MSDAMDLLLGRRRGRTPEREPARSGLPVLEGPLPVRLRAERLQARSVVGQAERDRPVRELALDLAVLLEEARDWPVVQGPTGR